MKYSNYFPILATSAALFLANPASAQMRPDCLANPDTSGVCFSSTSQMATLRCGSFLEGPGVLQIFSPEKGKGEFVQELPNGLELVHAPHIAATMGFCYWEDIVSGNCFPPAEGAFVGTGSFVWQGFENDQGFGCPLRIKGSGTLLRLSDGEMLDINLDMHTVPDATSPSGCATRVCQIIAPD